VRRAIVIGLSNVCHFGLAEKGVCRGSQSHEFFPLDVKWKLQTFDKTETNLRTGIDSFLPY